MQSSAETTNSLIRAIILDCSGTLFDDIILTWKIVNDIFARFGKRAIEFEEFRENFELPYFQIFLKYGLNKKDSKETSLRMYHDLYQRYEHLTKPFDQTKSCVESLSKAGYLLGIVSQTPRKLLDHQLKEMGLPWMIPNSIAKGEVPQEKPMPLPLFEMMQRLDVSRHEVLYGGDTADDMFCAQYAGVKSVAIGNGRSYNTAERLIAAEPDFFISSLGELTEMLLQKRTVLA